MNEQNELYKKLAECLRCDSDDRSKDQIYQQLINSLSNVGEPVCFFVSRNNDFQTEMFEYLNDKNKDSFFYGSRNIKNHYLFNIDQYFDKTFMIDEKAATSNFKLKNNNKKIIKKNKK